MGEVLRDCTTQDIERLGDVFSRLSAEVQRLQIEMTQGMEPRDQMIVVHASLAQLTFAAERAGKRSATPRFIRSIKTASTVARAFGSGRARASDL